MEVTYGVLFFCYFFYGIFYFINFLMETSNIRARLLHVTQAAIKDFWSLIYKFF